MADTIWALLNFLFPGEKLQDRLQGAGFKLVDSICSTIWSGLKDEVSLVRELDEELAKLGRTKVRIRARLEDADQRRRIIDQHVKLWLQELDGFALDAEDLLDLVRTRTEAFRQHHSTAAAQPNCRKRKRPWTDLLLSSVYDYSSSVPLWQFRRSVAKEVIEVNKRFEEITKFRRDLQERRGDGMRMIEGPSSQMTKGGVPDGEFVGMGSDRNAILELLCPVEANRVVDQQKKSKGKILSVIAIKGMGGSGKTVLVQSVYNEVQGFDKKIWIYVKREHGPERITREMLESLGEKSRFSNFDTSQRQLMNAISGKTLLLVLDNVDEPFLPCWDSVRASLRAVAAGSKVVVTTRSARVPMAMGATMIQLEGLSELEWLDLFKAKVGNLVGHPELENRAKKIAKKCHMSPLAAKILGSLISENRDAEQWESVLEEMLSDRDENLILKTLIISYEQLPLHLKRCFAFCAVFPEGHDLDKDELAKCWTALGFVEAIRPEAAGRRFFEDLVRLSFIEQLPITEQLPGARCNVRYRMPGLMHELARKVSAHQCVIVEKQGDRSSTSDSTKEARHALLHCAGVESEDELESLLLNPTLNQANRLRTFIMLHGDSKVCSNRLPGGLFQKMRCLRVLDLSCTEIYELPMWIGELQLLRYLNLSSTLIARLPDSVTTLRNLQALNLSDCYLLHELPKATSQLTNLRHLLLRLHDPRWSRLASMPPEIGKLTGLQTLSRFIVGMRTGGSGLDQMQPLTNIKGELWISKLENVQDAEDARKAKLAEKEIHTLTLEWTNRLECCRCEVVQHSDSDNDPISSQLYSIPSREQNCESENSSGSSSSSAAAALTESNPHRCHQSHLSPKIAKEVIDQLRPPPYLKTLRIDGYYGGTPPEWISQIQYLETVHLSDCQHWMSLDKLESLTQLKHLHVERCRWLAAMKPSDSEPDKFPALETLTLKRLPELKEWVIYKDQMPNLKKLCFFYCPKLRDPRGLIPASVNVEIKGCSFA